MQKSVQITIYVVKPRKTNHENVSGDRRRPLRNCAAGEAGFDRKAQLLLYSQQLRNIACCDQFQASRQKTEALKIRTFEKSLQKVTETLQQIASNSAKKVVPEELQKPVHGKSPQRQPQPSCFRDWRSVLLPSFIKRIFGSRNGKTRLS